MRLVNIRSQNPQLQEQVQAGEDVVVAKAGAPIVRLVPYALPGAMEGEIWMSDDFDKHLDDLFDCLKDDAK